MELDIDEILGWDLTVKIRGKRYKTLAPSLGDLLIIKALAQGDLTAGSEKLAEMGSSFLVLDGNPAPKLDPKQWMATILAVVDYWRSTQKKAGPIADSVKAAIETAQALEEAQPQATAIPTPLKSTPR